VVGSRMMGGGFGGCTINLVRKDQVDKFISEITAHYKSAFDIDMPAYQVNAVDGTGRVKDRQLQNFRDKKYFLY